MDHSPASRLTSAPERWVQHYVKKFGDEEPYTGKAGYGICRYPHATYAAMISYFDEQVGKLIQKLKAENLYDNTLIIFTSDNGPTFNGGSDSPWFNSGGWFKSEYGWGKCFLHEAHPRPGRHGSGKAKSSPVRKPTISVVFKTSCRHLPK